MFFEPNSPLIVAAAISGIVLIIVTLINNIFQLNREKKQRNYQEKSDKQKWYREKIYDCYKKCFEILIKIQQEQFERINNNKNNNNIDADKNTNNIYILIAEFYLEFLMIKVDHPDKDSKKFNEHLNMLDEFIGKNSWIVRAIVSEMMKNDSRIKDVNK